MEEAKQDFTLAADSIGQIISGKAIAAQIRDELGKQVKSLIEQTGKAPSLAVVLVGGRKDSQTYVRMKTKACHEVGIGSHQHNLSGETTEETLLALIDELNNDDHVNGILVQLPLPDHINSAAIVQAVKPCKDVDGLTAENLGMLMQQGDKAPLVACTPCGCVELLDRSGVAIEGRHAVVIGRSMLVGKPVAQLLMSRNATVTQCHSRTKDLGDFVRRADIVVAAVGRAGLVKGEWIKDGAVVLDVGTNAVDDPTRKRGYRLVGDVEFEEAKKHARGITPVPGGVGPMTVTMLLKNTVRAFCIQNKIAEN